VALEGETPSFDHFQRQNRMDVGRHGNGTLGDQSNPVYSEWVKIPRKGGPKGSDLCHAGGLLRRQ